MKKLLIFLLFPPAFLSAQDTYRPERITFTAPSYVNGATFRGERGSADTTTPTPSDLYCTEADALFARMVTAGDEPTTARKVVIDSTIRMLKTGGVWALLDVWQVYAASSESVALLNWLSTSFNATTSGSPTFDASLGYTGATGKYLNSNYNPSSDADNLSVNSASIGIWSLTELAEQSIDCGVNNTNAFQIASYFGASTIFYSDIFTSSGTTSNANTTSVGLMASSRTGALNTAQYVNNTHTDILATAVAIPDGKVYVCGRNNAGSADYPSTRQIAAFFVGGGMTDAQMLVVYNALTYYLANY